MKEEVNELYGFELGEVYNPNRSWYKPRNKTAAAAFYYDMVEIFRGLSVVVNSGPDSVGGGCVPALTPPPPLCTGAHVGS